MDGREAWRRAALWKGRAGVGEEVGWGGGEDASCASIGKCVGRGADDVSPPPSPLPREVGG